MVSWGWVLIKGLIRRLLSRYTKRRRLISLIRSRIWKGRSIFWLNFLIIPSRSWLKSLRLRPNFILFLSMEAPTLFTTICYLNLSIDCLNMKQNSFCLSFQRLFFTFMRGISSIGISKLRTFSSTDTDNSSWLILASVWDARKQVLLILFVERRLTWLQK